MINIIFFGSFQHYSSLILESLLESSHINVLGVITTPPKPKGRNGIISKTHTHILADSKKIPVFCPDNLNEQSLKEFNNWLQAHYPENKVLVNQKSTREFDDNLNIHFFVVAGFGKLLPPEWLDYPQITVINLHFSLLPKYRGANPAEWAILYGEKETGVTAIKMNAQFDKGEIITQKKIPIESEDTKISLYEKLYGLAGQMAPEVLLNYYQWSQTVNEKSAFKNYFLPPLNQPSLSSSPYAKMLNKANGFVAWTLIQEAMMGKNVSALNRPELFLNIEARWPELIQRAVKAMKGYPTVWTIVQTINGEKRLILHSAHIENGSLKLDNVQIEGQQIAKYNQICASLK